MSLTFRFGFDDARARSAYASARARALDLRPAYRSMGAAGVAQTRKRFTTKRAPDGSAWKPTRKIGGSTMIESALLLRSLTSRLTPNGVEWGSNRIYAAVHQAGINREVQVKAHERFGNVVFGRRFERKFRFQISAHSRQMKVDARPYLGLNGQDEAELLAILLRHAGEPLIGGQA
ncbi:MAG: phage virion morphogenesis protein [Pseudomonadota bacterium]